MQLTYKEKLEFLSDIFRESVLDEEYPTHQEQSKDAEIKRVLPADSIWMMSEF